MRIPFAVFLSLSLALPMLAAPVAHDTDTEDVEAAAPEKRVADPLPFPTIVGGELLEVRKAKAKAAPKKAVKAKPPPKPKPAPKPKAKPVAKPKPAPKPKPVAKKPAAKPPAKKPAAKPPAKKPAAKPPAKPPVKPAAKPPAKKPAAKPPAKKPAAKPPVKKPAAKPPVKKPAAKPPVKKPADKPPAKKPAAKPPVKKPAAKPPTKAPAKTTPKPPAKKPVAKPPTKSASAKPTASSAKTACPLKPKKSPSRVKGRAGVSHPSGTGTISLFHGTTSSNAAALEAQGVLLSKTASRGDFSHRPESDGGFYMADSLIAAAQFACHEAQQPRSDTVDVLEYTWHGAGTKVKAFPSANKEFDDFLEYNEGPDTDEDDVANVDDPFHAQALVIYQNDMITGPLPPDGIFDKDLNKSLFQQYAVVKQAAATSKLTLKTRHKNILCKNVPKGTALTATQYEETQGGNPNFATAVAALQDPNACT